MGSVNYEYLNDPRWSEELRRIGLANAGLARRVLSISSRPKLLGSRSQQFGQSQIRASVGTLTKKEVAVPDIGYHVRSAYQLPNRKFVSEFTIGGNHSIVSWTMEIMEVS